MSNRKGRPRIILAAIVAAGATIAVAGASSASPAGDPASVLRADLAPYTTPHAGAIVDSGVTGRAMLVTPAGSTGTTARIEAAGLEPGHEYGVHVHFGACLEFRGHFQFEFPGPVTRANEVWLDLTANRAGRARDQVKVPEVSGGLGQLSVVIHAQSNPDLAPGEPGHPGARIACGDFG